MINWYKKVVFENYANFNGRARRSEYWYFFLANLLIGILFFVLALGTGILRGEMGPAAIIILVINALYSLFVIIPSLAVTVRRLHDVGKSGWYYFIQFIPLIGIFWFYYLMFSEGDSGPNEYGPDPKGDYQEVEEIGVPEA